MKNVEEFRNNIIEFGVLDPEGIHHEFVSGMHGRKLDFDIVDNDIPLYSEWIQVAHDYIEAAYPDLPEVIIGVANGTNRVALDTARKFDGKVFGAVSEKDSQNSKILRLGKVTEGLISALKPKLVLVLEDVGTTGSNSVQVACQSLEAGAQEVEVLTTWQRRPRLERLEEANIPYQAIINEALITYMPEECRKSGFCSNGWEFIPRAS